MRRLTISVLHLCLSVFICGSLSCDRGTAADTKTVVLYTSIDEPIARPIIEAFEKAHGVKVTLVTDTEANKSVGLAEKLRAEKDRPRADVWWGNEPFHTINLAEEGLFAAYESPSAADVPAMFRDPKHRWAGNGLRARVIAHWIPRRITLAPEFRSILAIPQTQLSNAFVMARPTSGTTGGHVAALSVALGNEEADRLFRGLRAVGTKLVGGNSVVVSSLGFETGFRAGLTDNDDAAAGSSQHPEIVYVLPDQGPNDMGTLMIPTTVALVGNRPANTDANKLIDYLLSKEVEQKLIEAQFAGWSIRGGKNQPKAMQVDYTEVAKKMPEAVRRATAILEGREP